MNRLSRNLVKSEDFPKDEPQGDDDAPPAPSFKVPNSRDVSSYRNAKTNLIGGRWRTSTTDEIKPFVSKLGERKVYKADDAYVPRPKFGRNITAREMANRLEQQLLSKMQGSSPSTSGRRTHERMPRTSRTTPPRQQVWKGWVRSAEDTNRIRTEPTSNKPNHSSSRRQSSQSKFPAKVVTTDRRGQPRELVDSYRPMPIHSYTKGLSGAGVKCFRRFLDQGLEPEEARRKVDERKLAREKKQQEEQRNRAGGRNTYPTKTDVKRREPTSTVTTEHYTGLLIQKNMPGARYTGAPKNIRAGGHPRANLNTVSHTNKNRSSTDASYMGVRKNMRAALLPQERPNANLTSPAGKNKRKSGAGTTYAGSPKKMRVSPKEHPKTTLNTGLGTNKKKSGTNVLKNMRLAILPKEYPKATLTTEELTALEDAIVEEVALGSEGTLQFSGIFFQKSLLLIHCANEQTTHWLLEAAKRLSGWTGIELMACMEDDIPKAYNITIFLPRSAGQEQNKSLALIKAQNEGLKTHLWKIISTRDENKGQIVSILIDGESATTIISKGYTLSYRFGKVAVCGLKKQADTIAPPHTNAPIDDEDVEIIETTDNGISIGDELESIDSTPIDIEDTDDEALKVVLSGSSIEENELPSIEKELESKDLATLNEENTDVEALKVVSAASPTAENGLPFDEKEVETNDLATVNIDDSDVEVLKVVSAASATAENRLPSIEKELNSKGNASLNMMGTNVATLDTEKEEYISVEGEEKGESEQGISLASENN